MELGAAERVEPVEHELPDRWAGVGEVEGLSLVGINVEEAAVVAAVHLAGADLGLAVDWILLGGGVGIDVGAGHQLVPPKDEDIMPDQDLSAADRIPTNPGIGRPPRGREPRPHVDRVWRREPGGSGAIVPRIGAREERKGRVPVGDVGEASLLLAPGLLRDKAARDEGRDPDPAVKARPLRAAEREVVGGATVGVGAAVVTREHQERRLPHPGATELELEVPDRLVHVGDHAGEDGRLAGLVVEVLYRDLHGLVGLVHVVVQEERGVAGSVVVPDDPDHLLPEHLLGVLPRRVGCAASVVPEVEQPSGLAAPPTALLHREVCDARK